MSKKGKGRPLFVPKGRRKLGQPSKLSARARAALDRTKAKRVELDARIEGVDISDMKHLKVAHYPMGKPKPPGLKGKVVEDEEIVYDPEQDALRVKPPMAPPVPYDKNELLATQKPRLYLCSECGKAGHTRKNCPKFAPAPIAPPAVYTPPIAPPVDGGKKQRRTHCGTCGRTGHNSGACPDTISAETWKRIDELLGKKLAMWRIAQLVRMSPSTLKRALRTRAIRTETAASPAAA